MFTSLAALFGRTLPEVAIFYTVVYLILIGKKKYQWAQFLNGFLISWAITAISTGFLRMQFGVPIDSTLVGVVVPVFVSAVVIFVLILLGKSEQSPEDGK